MKKQKKKKKKKKTTTTTTEKNKIQHPSTTLKIHNPIPTKSIQTLVNPKPNSRSKSAPHRHTQQKQTHLLLPTTPICSMLSRDFYQTDVLHLAPRLLGKHLKRDDVVLQITEVEAYGQNDSASHGRFGLTARTSPIFGPGGHAYVYLCYGLHVMLNVVADKEGIGAGVLIRSCAPVSGLETIQQRRGSKSDKPNLLTGPGKVGQALGLSTEWCNHPLYLPGGLELLNGADPENIVAGPRVGIDYALPEHVNAAWRFAIAGSPWISTPKNTLKPVVKQE